MTKDAAPQYAYEDFTEGRVFALGPYTVTESEIVAFAAEFDPQPMHLDADAGQASLLGGLAASGWHMASLMMRMMADSYLLDSTSFGAPGVDSLSWKRPLLAGDTLTGTTTVTGRRLSASRPGIGIVTLAHALANQRGETVVTCEHPAMIGLRETRR